MLGQRLISAAILIPLVLAATHFGGLGFFVLIVLVGMLAGYEYCKMMRLQGLRPSYLLGLLLIALLLVDAQWPALGMLRWGLTFMALAALTLEVFHENAPGSLVSWALVVAGGAYIGLTLGHFVRLRNLERGEYWFYLALVGTWVCDTGAYFVGRTLGKTHFFPQISPKKTWEGAIGGLVSGVIAVVLMAYYGLGVGIGGGLILGGLLVLGAIFGDLAESVIKRQVGAKDSGNLIPGHGGMLDRVDSLLFVVPIVYYFAVTWMQVAP